MSIIKTQDLNYIYSQNTPFQKAALVDINIEINSGELVGVIGHTGSGKSTLMQHFNGLLKPTKGKVFVDGVDIWQKPELINQLRFKVGLVFQYPEYQLFEETVEKDIAFGPRNMGLSNDEIKHRVYNAAKIVGLDEGLLKKSPFDLSGGEKRRAALAGVLAMEPKVLILDEPTAGLDPIGRDTILERIVQYREKTNSTVLLVSHSMEDIAKVADKVLVMNNSSIFMYDTVENVYSKADQLAQIGLNVPHITKVFMGLKQRSITVSDGVYTVDKAFEVLYSLFKQKGVVK